MHLSAGWSPGTHVGHLSGASIPMAPTPASTPALWTTTTSPASPAKLARSAAARPQSHHTASPGKGDSAPGRESGIADGGVGNRTLAWSVFGSAAETEAGTQRMKGHSAEDDHPGRLGRAAHCAAGHAIAHQAAAAP